MECSVCSFPDQPPGAQECILCQGPLIQLNEGISITPAAPPVPSTSPVTQSPVSDGSGEEISEHRASKPSPREPIQASPSAHSDSSQSNAAIDPSPPAGATQKEGPRPAKRPQRSRRVRTLSQRQLTLQDCSTGNSSLLERLLSMGFPKAASSNAARQCSNLSEAIDFVLATISSSSSPPPQVIDPPSPHHPPPQAESSEQPTEAARRGPPTTSPSAATAASEGPRGTSPPAEPREGQWTPASIGPTSRTQPQPLASPASPPVSLLKCRFNARQGFSPKQKPLLLQPLSAQQQSTVAGFPAILQPSEAPTAAFQSKPSTEGTAAAPEGLDNLLQKVSSLSKWAKSSRSSGPKFISMLSQESASASEEVAVAPQKDKEEEEEEVSEALDLTNSSAVNLATEGEASKEAGNISKGSGMKDDVVLDSRDWDSDGAGGIPGPASDDEEDIVLSDEDDEGPGESMAEHRSSSSKERTRLTDSPRRAKNSTASSSTASSALWGAAATGAASDAASQRKPWELSQDGSDDFDLDSALAELEHIRSRAKTALSESRRFTDGSAAPSKRSAAAASLWDISPSRPMVKGRRGIGSSSSSAGAGALPQRDDDSDTPEDIVLEEEEGEGSSNDDSRGIAHGRRRATGEGAREVISVEDSDDSFFPFDEESDEEPPRHYGELDFNSPHQLQSGAQQGNSGGRQSIPDAFGWDDVPRQAQGAIKRAGQRDAEGNDVFIDYESQFAGSGAKQAQAIASRESARKRRRVQRETKKGSRKRKSTRGRRKSSRGRGRGRSRSGSFSSSRARSSSAGAASGAWTSRPIANRALIPAAARRDEVLQPPSSVRPRMAAAVPNRPHTNGNGVPYYSGVLMNLHEQSVEPVVYGEEAEAFPSESIVEFAGGMRISR